MLLILRALILVLVLVKALMAAPHVMKSQEDRGNNINVFLTMAWQVGKLIQPNSSCYVCGVMPYTAGQGLPLMALPASDCDTCHLMHIPLSQSHTACPSISKMRPLNCSGAYANCARCTKTPKPVPILLIPQQFTWCLENDGETPVGESDCLHTYKWGPGQAHTEFRSEISPSQPCLEAVGHTRLSALARRTSSCSISSPVGMYWVCGNLAYPYLPVNYKGRCGLAHVVPAMRVTHSLPQKAPKRARRGVSDIFGTHSQSPFKNTLGLLLPFYGVMSALDQISDLSRAIEVIANETSKALMLLSSELASVRLLALQNRAALDFLLAAQGGTCAVIGSECCTFVPDYNANMSDIVSRLQDTATSVHHQDSGTLSDWVSSTFGPMSYHIVKVLIILAVFLVLFSCFMSCMKKFLCNI